MSDSVAEAYLEERRRIRSEQERFEAMMQRSEMTSQSAVAAALAGGILASYTSPATAFAAVDAYEAIMAKMKRRAEARQKASISSLDIK